MRNFTFCLATLLMSFALNVQAQRNITSFTERVITNGSSITIGGKVYTEPDIIYTSDGSGGYRATRLTVAPVRAEAVTRPYLNNVTPHAACISWKTDKVATGSVVRLGTRADALDMTFTNSSEELASAYYWNTVSVTGLQPATTYYYQVESNGVTSDICHFHTMPLNGDQGKFRILLLGDHQHNEHSDYEWMLKAAQQKADELYGKAEMNEHFRLLLNVGDQVDKGEVSEYEMKHLYKSRSVMSSLPIMTTVGNHETAGDGELKLYDGHFHLYGQLDYQGIKSGTANYYAYQTGALLIIVLNSEGTTTEQETWLRQVMQAADQDPTVCFIMASQHRPLYAEQWYNDVSPWMKDRMMPILSSSPKFVLDYAGHHHLYARGQMTDSPVYHIISGGGVGTTASGYEQLWGTTPDNRDEDAVQKTIDQWTYQIVEFDAATKTMKVDCYSIGNRRLALDNKLVDSFSRCLSDPSLPDTPQLRAADGSRFPIAIMQQQEVAGLHSAEYQVATDADFRQKVLDRVVTFEDFYNVNDDFTPKNQNPSGMVTTLKIEDGDIAQGKYYVRCRNRNMNLGWSGYSAPIELTVTAQSSKPSIQLDKRIYATGDNITINYRNAPVGQQAWVGLYEGYKEPKEGQFSKVWSYTADASGTLTLKITDPGEYYAVLFADGGYNVIAGRVPFIVTDNCNETDNPFSMEMKQTVLDENEDVVVKFENAPMLPSDWVGVYSVNQVHENEPVTGAFLSYVWNYVSAVSQELNLNQGKVNTVPPAGYYFAAYFFSNGYTSFFPRQYFVVGKPAVVSASKASFSDEEAVTMSCYNLPAWQNVSLAVCNGQGNVVQTYALDEKESGEVVIPEGQLPVGHYTAHVSYGDATKTISADFPFDIFSATGISAVGTGNAGHRNGKFIKDGQLLIRKGGRSYNAGGARQD